MAALLPLPTTTQLLVAGHSVDEHTRQRFLDAGFAVLGMSRAADVVRHLLSHPREDRLITAWELDGMAGSEWMRFLEEHFSDRALLVVARADQDTGPFVAIPPHIDLVLVASHLERTNAWRA